MKKEYFKPEVQAIELELETSVLLIATSNPEVGGGGTNKPITPLSNKKREWGNVWQ